MNARLGREVNFARGKILSVARALENVYIVLPAQETAKHCTNVGSPPVSDVAAVTKAKRETH